jgi:hypothetical protein
VFPDSIDSLKKLHRKAKSTDAYLEDKGELNTARSAWGEVRDNLERGAFTPPYTKQGV